MSTLKTHARRTLHVSLIALAVSHAITAMAAETETSDSAVRSVEEIVIQGQIGYRNRSDDAVPTLEYGLDYIQRFEPLTAGDALKRMPSVTFLSDVIESDGVRMRGLDPGYTKVLINGEQVPGASTDRSFFMDRIPAEMIERVEVVRSSSARRSADAMAGTLNIVMRDGFSMDGGYVRLGGLRFDDGEYKESLAAVWGGEVGGGRLIVGANRQGRYNPKVKESFRFGDSPENNSDFVADDFDNREDQDDTRDGTDTSFNASYDIALAEGTDLGFDGFYVKTDRTETERSRGYDDAVALTGPVPAGALLSDNANVNDIDQDNYTFSTSVDHDWSLGKTSAKFSLASFDSFSGETEEEIEFDRATPRFTGDLTNTDINDEERSAELEHAVAINESMEFGFGVFVQRKERDTDIRTQRNRFNAASAVGWNQFARNPNELRTPWNNLQPETGGLNSIEEDRNDYYLVLNGEADRLAWEAGVRYETTDMSIADLTDNTQSDNDYDFVLPSAHIRYDLTDLDRVTASVARTVRRPNFNFISPALLEAELGDNDLLGNPDLAPESAVGFDIGFEHRIGNTGVVGINYFRRDVKDLTEVANTGVEGSEGDGTFVLQPRNSGDGEVSGVEIDLSTPLSVVNLDNTGVFLNYSWLDSEIEDTFGTRRFNDQSKSVYNVGFIQDLPMLAGAFGATYRKQDDAYGRIVGEEVTTTYGADLEVFIEKRFGEKLTMRLVGSNLLDGAKEEVFNKFTTIEDQVARNFDEYELESETAGPYFQFMVRMAL
ncbi:MAG: TonB-dependent receptor [Pseudomonadota bacterium]